MEKSINEMEENMTKRKIFVLVIVFFMGMIYLNCHQQTGKQNPSIDKPTLLEEIEAFAHIPSVTGRETLASDFIRSRLSGLALKQDALGNVILTLGSGNPRRLFTAPLDEPGYVISGIQKDGYLRITPVGSSFNFGGTLAHQFHQGQKIIISTEKGPVYGAVTVGSTHLSRSRQENSRNLPPFTWQEAFVDVGAESSDEVAKLGVQMLDTACLIKRPTILQGKMIAAPAIQSKAACLALVDAARRLKSTRIKGTLVLAWTVLETLNGRGIDAIVHSSPEPFDEMYLFSSTFGFSIQERRITPGAVPIPGGGVLIDNPDIKELSGLIQAPHVPIQRGRLRSPRLKNTMVRYIGLPTRYQWTPVELIHIQDVQNLADTWVQLAGGNIKQSISIPPLTNSVPEPRPNLPHAELSQSVAGLIAPYGVSRAETPVREYIQTLLPPWMKTSTDEAGNLTTTFGKGDEHIVFIAHMDETGYRVQSILEDGRLMLAGSAGYSWLWEAQAALVHIGKEDISAVFEPRNESFRADKRRPSESLTVYLGFNSKAEVEALGVKPGQSTVTMPKQMHRIGTYRILARGLDDRAGCAALIQVAHRIDPKNLKRRVTFAFSVGEEIGLVGAITLAKHIRDATYVCPVDTFVSSDAPMESSVNALCPLGKGAVLRVLESANFTPRYLIKKILSLAEENHIQVQVGNTFGGTDGGPFVVYGIPSLPLSWPGRYSHSPIEVLDLRDLDSLIQLITAMVSSI